MKKEQNCQKKRMSHGYSWEFQRMHDHLVDLIAVLVYRGAVQIFTYS